MVESSEKYHRFEDLLSHFRDGHLVTLNSEGQMKARPMYLLRRDDSNNLWIATNIHSAAAQEIQKDSRVCLTLQMSNRWISISGNAEVVQDKQKMKEMWEEGLRVYFPQGEDTPDLCLLKIKASMAEYWDTSSMMSKLQYAFEAGRAYLKGERMHPQKVAPHEQIKLK